MIGDVIGWIAGLFGGGARERVDPQRERYSPEAGRVRGAMRTSLGEAPGLSRRWRGIEVEPRPGVIAYDRQRLTVLRAFRRSEPMSPREELAVPLVVSPVVIDLHVPGASLEWAIPAPDVDWVLDALKTDGMTKPPRTA